MDPTSSGSESSEGEDTEQQYEEIGKYGQKIFFTDGGHTNKHSKGLLRESQLKQLKIQKEMSKDSKCSIF